MSTAAPPVNFDNIPATLRGRDQWCLWRLEKRDGDLTKIPYQPNGRRAKSNDRSTWAPFLAVRAAYDRGGFSGVGFMFDKDDPFCGIDLDGCIDPKSGAVAPWAAEILERADPPCYAEVSPSGTGVKLFCMGRPAFKEGKRRVATGEPVGEKAPAIEVYAGGRGRYFTVTGAKGDGVGDEPTDQAALLAFIGEKYWTDAAPPETSSAATKLTEQKQRGRKAKRRYNPAEWTDPDKLRRARHLFCRLAPSVSGDHGHDRLFHAACLTVECDLSPADARTLLREYNAAAQPPWSEAELDRKLAEAEKHGCERGSKLGRPPIKRQPGDERPVIVVDTDEARVNAEALAALAKDPGVFTSGGELVYVVHPKGDVPRLAGLREGFLQERLAATAEYVQLVESGGGVDEKPCHPPTWTVKAVAQRGNYPELRTIVGVVNHPVVRPDGTLATKYGYDPATMLFIGAEVPLAVRDRPTREDAQGAAAVLRDLMIDFPFVAESHFATWLAGLLTPICRPAFVGHVPIFFTEANAAGSGKGLSNDVSCVIRNGHEADPTKFKDEEELRKKLTAGVRAGEREFHLDNITGKFGNGTLDAFATGRFWRDRILGVSQNGRWRNDSTIYATGNNATIGEDTQRRTALIRLSTNLEHPEDRNDFKRPKLIEYVREHRAELLSAALTIVRAYIVAGRPPQAMKPWGSFEAWSDLVRGAIMFAGCADPGLTRIELQQRSGTLHEAVVLLAEELYRLSDLTPDGLTTKEMKGRLSEDVLNAVAVARSIDEVTPNLLGHTLRRFEGRRIGDYLIRRSEERGAGGFRWVAQAYGSVDVVDRVDAPAPAWAGENTPAHACSAHAHAPANTGTTKNSTRSTTSTLPPPTGDDSPATVRAAACLKRVLDASPVPVIHAELAAKSRLEPRAFADGVDYLLRKSIARKATVGSGGTPWEVYGVPENHGDPEAWARSANGPPAAGRDSNAIQTTGSLLQ